MNMTFSECLTNNAGLKVSAVNNTANKWLDVCGLKSQWKAEVRACSRITGLKCSVLEHIHTALYEYFIQAGNAGEEFISGAVSYSWIQASFKTSE